MKTTNQFDYPTATATTYKAYRPPEPSNNTKIQQKYYKQVIRQESELERNRVKQDLQKKKEKMIQDQQLRIREQIERKKRELQELVKMKEQAIVQEKRAAEQAKIKEQQDRIKKIENEQKARENQQNAQFRFRDALRRLEAERQENSIQERQAQLRRKVANETQKYERQKAIKYKDYLIEKEQQQRQREEEDQKRQFQLMKNGLGRFGLHKVNIDYSKTCFHNPHVIFKNTQQGPNAFERGESEERRKKQLSLRKKQQQDQARRRSLERGSKALEKISKERQYQIYSKQTEDQQIEYNMKRIEQGKRNQFIGIKPLTLAQMDSNKKIRGQQQFEQLFLPPTVQVYQAPASKYLIVQKKFTPHNTSYSRNLYSSIENREQYTAKSLYPQNYKYQDQEQSQEPAEQPNPTQPTPIDKKLAITRAEQSKQHKQQLNYSQSQDDSSYA